MPSRTGITGETHRECGRNFRRAASTRAGWLLVNSDGWSTSSLMQSHVGCGAAFEERPNVIRVDDKVPGPTEAHLDGPRDPRDHDRTVWIHLTREQLRSVAWAEVDIFDDTVLDVIPRTTTPVWTGLITFQFFTEEELDTMRPGRGTSSSTATRCARRSHRCRRRSEVTASGAENAPEWTCLARPCDAIAASTR